MITIDSDEHRITIKGSEVGIRLDLTMLIRQMLIRGIMEEEEIDRCVRYAKMTNEELDAEAEQRLEECRKMVEECGTEAEREMFAFVSMMLAKQ